MKAELEKLINQEGAREPLRCQQGVGMGGQHVAEQVEELQRRLLEGYADAAL